MKGKLQLAFAGPDLLAVLRDLRARDLPRAGDPDKVLIDAKTRKVGPKWLEQASNCKVSFMAWWKGGWLSFNRANIVKLSISDFEIDPAWLLELLESLPVTLMSNDTVFQEWQDGTLGKEYLPPGFADLHWPHGAFCAFKGAGHDRLVSRRWLDYGPWRLMRGKNDTSLVQFHDLDVDAKTALEQARVAHARMGISPTGGFFQNPFHFEHKLKGRYLPGLRKLDFVVNGRKISDSEMLDAAAMRHEQVLGPDQPIDSVAYTFVVEEEGRAHLHELWLHGLECWAIIKGKELRLDTDHRPSAAPPDWVKRLAR